MAYGPQWRNFSIDIKRLWTLHACICNETSDSQLFLCRLNEAGGRKTVQVPKQAQCKYCTALSPDAGQVPDCLRLNSG